PARAACRTPGTRPGWCGCGGGRARRGRRSRSCRAGYGRAAGPARARTQARVPARSQSDPRRPRRADARQTRRGASTRGRRRDRAPRTAPRGRRAIPARAPRQARPILHLRRRRSFRPRPATASLKDTLGGMTWLVLSLVLAQAPPSPSASTLTARVQKLVAASGAEVAVVMKTVDGRDEIR